VINGIIEELLANVLGNLLPSVVVLTGWLRGLFIQDDALEVFDVAVDYAEVSLQLGTRW